MFNSTTHEIRTHGASWFSDGEVDLGLQSRPAVITDDHVEATGQLRTDRSCRSVGTASATGEVIAAGGARYSLQQRWTMSQAAAGSRASARSKQEMTAKTWWLQMVSREKFARSAMMGVAKSED